MGMDIADFYICTGLRFVIVLNILSAWIDRQTGALPAVVLL